MCAPKFRSPGISRSAWLTLVVVRSISASEVPGWVTQWMRKSGSLKCGKRD